MATLAQQLYKMDYLLTHTCTGLIDEMLRCLDANEPQTITKNDIEQLYNGDLPFSHNCFEYILQQAREFNEQSETEEKT